MSDPTERSGDWFDVAIVGGGFAGTIVAVQLARISAQPLRIVIFDRAGAFGRGTAYSPASDECLLNVRAKAMGAFPDAEGDFVRWLRANGYGADPDLGERFLPRRLYGAYLASLLDGCGGAGSTVVRHAADVRELVPESGGYRVKTSCGASWKTRTAVVATGNLRPGGFDKPALDAALAEHAIDPWAFLADGVIDRTADVLIIGTGLSALDVLATLAASPHRGRISMLSRRGRFPLAHIAPSPVPAAWSAALASFTGSPYHALRMLRRLVREADADGVRWQDVIDALRPYVNGIWQQWTPAQMQQFLRHLAPLWEIHRHRAPQALLAVRDAMIAAGRLQVHRGRLSLIAREGAHLRVHYRNTEDLEAAIEADVVVDCRGSRRRFTPSGEAVIDALIRQNIARPGPLGLGLLAEPNGLLVGSARAGSLYALGSPLRGTLLESSAVREIRAQAHTIAEAIVARAEPARDRVLQNPGAGVMR